MVTPLLEMRNISKSFPGVQALKDVSIELAPGQVVGLIGENGAGKSTLMKILVGFYHADQGQILLEGQPITVNSVKDAGKYGIGMVFQEQALLGNISIAENIFLGSEEAFTRFGIINWKEMNQAARKLLEELGYDFEPTMRTDKLNFSNRQMVELARVLALAERSKHTPIIIFDEPTTVGSQDDVAKLFGTILRLKDRGASIVFISHRLEEVLEIADVVYVFKDGERVAFLPTAQATTNKLHHLMVGREKSAEYYREKEQRQPDETVVLELDKCSLNGSFWDVSLELHKGEILGICGVIGSGREALLRSIAGIVPFDQGEVHVGGEKVVISNSIAAKEQRIGYAPVDRRAEGLIQYFDLASNISLTNPSLALKKGLLSRRKEIDMANKWVERLHIKALDSSVLAMTLSGGNQQKVVLAKWLAAGVQILILDHPTRGIDVGAKEEVYALIRQLAKEGMAILLTSDALPETIALSNRVIVMKDGRVQKVFDSPPGNKPEEFLMVECMC